MHLHFHIQLQGKLLVRNLRVYRTIIEAHPTLQTIINPPMLYKVELLSLEKKALTRLLRFACIRISKACTHKIKGTIKNHIWMKESKEIIKHLLHCTFIYYQLHIHCSVQGWCSLLLHNLWINKTSLRSLALKQKTLSTVKYVCKWIISKLLQWHYWSIMDFT